MSVTSGFFDHKNGDRAYTASQMGRIFDGIIRDGVYSAYGQCFAVTALSGMTVNVGTGRAWFDHTWILNDALQPMTVEESEVILDRIDALVFDIDNRIDISSYVSDLTGVNNEYTPTVNGWICVRSGNATKISILDSATNIGNQSVSSTATYLTVIAPCIANKKVYINIVCTSLSHAYFIPCQGNV